MPYASSSAAATTTPHRKNAAFTNQSESPYQRRTNQKDNPTQQLIKQSVDFLLQQLEAGKSEALTAYLAAMARFHSYSFGNILAIARQRPTATRVAGYSTWREFGRFVRKGEKGWKRTPKMLSLWLAANSMIGPSASLLTPFITVT